VCPYVDCRVLLLAFRKAGKHRQQMFARPAA